MAEGAPLLREYRVKSSIEGSNPSHSARYKEAPADPRSAGVFLYGRPSEPYRHADLEAPPRQGRDVLQRRVVRPRFFIEQVAAIDEHFHACDVAVAHWKFAADLQVDQVES